MSNEKKWSPRKAVILLGLACALAWTAAIMAANAANAQDKSVWGTIIGGAGGGYLGSHIGKGRGRLAATAAGTLLGALLGNSTGRSLDRADAMYRQQGGYNYGVPNRVSAHWGRGHISHPYERRQHRRVVMHRPAPVNNGCTSGYTREYQTVVTVGGREVPAYGRACYMPDGTWRKMAGLRY